MSSNLKENRRSSLLTGLMVTAAAVGFVACASASSVDGTSSTAHVIDETRSDKKPGKVFDLSHWKITLPMDKNRDGKVDEIDVKKIQKYSHPDFFYLDGQDRMVFASPNKATTSKNSSNTRSELRYMLRGKNTKYRTHGSQNNFTLDVNPNSDKYVSVGGRMEATLHVDHVSRNAGNPNSKPAYSVVVGQIHAVKYKDTSSGFGHGNEPLKIYYKKWPGHDTGSVFWTYERNLAKKDPKRTDIAYPVFGNTWENSAAPGSQGIALGEEFSYVVNVYKNTMHLTFSNDRLGTKTYSINLANNVDAYGNVDPDDNRWGYAIDSHYFKAGAYNQCSTKPGTGFWNTGCPGTGKWETDKADGNYTQATFSRLVVSDATPQ